jgi:hypothetical protein
VGTSITVTSFVSEQTTVEDGLFDDTTRVSLN